MAKLEIDRRDASHEAASTYATLHDAFSPNILETIRQLNARMELAWTSFKTKNRKSPLIFRSKHAPYDTRQLSLLHSGLTLRQIMDDFTRSSLRANMSRGIRADSFVSPALLKVPYQPMIDEYTSLYEHELSLQSFLAIPLSSK